jgi:hypothetical protein
MKKIFCAIYFVVVILYCADVLMLERHKILVRDWLKDKWNFCYACLMMPVVMGWGIFAFVYWSWITWRCDKDDLGDIDICAD